MARNTKELKRIIDIVERRFGPRVQGWKMKPVVVQGQNYPQTMVSEIERIFYVRLTESTRNHPQQALFQLTHEAVHCLSPAERTDTLWFEEGLANHHSLTFPELPKSYLLENEKIIPSLFAGPLEAFRSLDPTDQEIRTLRSIDPDFNSWDASKIQQHFGTTEGLAEKLARRLPLERAQTM